MRSDGGNPYEARKAHHKESECALHDRSNASSLISPGSARLRNLSLTHSGEKWKLVTRIPLNTAGLATAPDNREYKAVSQIYY